MTLYENYSDKKPIGIFSFNAFFGILFFEPSETNSNDFFICCLTNGKDRWNFRRHDIRYYQDRPFIYKANTRIFLDEVIRSDI